jgi:hypothetical protein
MDSVVEQGSGNRRRWLSLLGGCAAFFAAGAWARQTQPQNPTRPTGNEPAAPGEEGTKLQPPTKAILEANDKDIKKSVERLYQLAGELKTEVEKTDSVQILSLAMVKKAEEIEKLAREIKSRAKG